MNKILIALVLAVGLSGNVFADELYIYCDNEWNEGYVLNRSQNASYKLVHSSATDQIERYSINEAWSPNYVSWEYSRSAWRINRKTLTLEVSKYGKATWDVSKCSLVDTKEDLNNLIEKKRAEKTKGNKF